MANASTGWICTHKAWVTKYDDVSDTIRVECYWTNQGWDYNINHVSAWVYCNGEEYEVKNDGSVNSEGDDYKSVLLGYHDFYVPKTTSYKGVPCYAKITSNSSYTRGTKSSELTSVGTGAKTSYNISYNANGGSGTPSTQTKWYGTNITLSSSKPTRSGYIFSKWNTKADGSGTSYNPGATYSSNATVTLYAIWITNTYTVSYNANGGTGAPGNQTKTHDVDLTLSSTKPTRTNYNFLGWSTSSNGGVVYSPGAKYTNNAAVTLYAVWELGYLKPRILTIGAQRCTNDGGASESGTYIKIEFDWVTDKNVSSIKIEWKKQTDQTWNTPVTVSATGLGGSVSQVIGNGDIDVDTTWNIRVSISDSGGTTPSPVLTVSSKKFAIDVYRGGKGLAFNKAAEIEGLFDINFRTMLRDGLAPVMLDANVNLDDIYVMNFYTSKDVEASNYSNCPISKGSFHLEVANIGDEAQIVQTLTSCDPTNNVTYRRFSIRGIWSEWQKFIPNGIAEYKASAIDPDTTLSSLILTDKNGPSGGFYYIVTLFYAAKTTTNNRTQIAIPYTYETGTTKNLIYIRQNVEGVWNEWKCIGQESKVLYDNASGTEGGFTLNDSYSNYSRLEIIHEGGTVIWYTSSPRPYVQIYSYGTDELTLIHQVKTLRFSNGTTVTADTTRRSYAYSGTVTNDDKNYIKVYKVIGYK